MFRNSLSREIVVGAPDKVEQATYGAVITRVESELEDELTGGWKIIEVSVIECASYRLAIYPRTDGKTWWSILSIIHPVIIPANDVNPTQP